MEFPQTPADHLACSEPCPRCGKRHLDKEEFEKRGTEKHSSKYIYDLVVFEHAKDTVIVICPEHGEFSQIVDNHLRGNGCPKCVDFLNSKGVKIIEEFLNSKGIKFKREKKFSGLTSNSLKKTSLRFDFYIKEYRLLIEFDGRQHFQPVDVFGGRDSFERLVANDRKKDDWAKKNSYKLIRISYEYEDSIEKILCEYIKTIQDL